ncbi:27326_t:CDS:2, partial [Racocetra persica]
IADSFKRTDRTIRNWRKEPNRPLQKVGRKPKISENNIRLLVSFLNASNTSNLEKMSDYLYKEIGERFSVKVIHQTLQKYDITMDECGFNLGEAPRYAWSRKGLRAIVPRPGQRGFNYTLILCVRNVNKQAVISYKLIENKSQGKKKGTDALDFYNFLKEIELPTNELYHLLLDNARIHYTTKRLRELGLSIEELASQKNIVLVYLPPHSPELNPVEKCFNNIRHNIEKSRPRTYEELKLIVDKEIAKLQQQSLTKYFQKPKLTLTVSLNSHLFKRLKSEIEPRQVSAFVEKAIAKELGAYDQQLEREQQKFVKKLIDGYQRSAQSKALKKEKQSKIRPVLILSNNWQNQYNDYSVVAPLTSEEEELQHIEVFEVLIEANKENGLDKKSKILLHRLLAIDKEERLIKKLGRIAAAAVEATRAGLKTLLADCDPGQET